MSNRCIKRYVKHLKKWNITSQCISVTHQYCEMTGLWWVPRRPENGVSVQKRECEIDLTNKYMLFQQRILYHADNQRKKMKVLVIEDDEVLAEYIAKGLTEHGYIVDISINGKDGLYFAVTEVYDIIILDKMLPNVDGITILKTIRASNNNTLVLILSAQSSIESKIEGLTEGADDYLTKPFAFEELKARVEALSRRRGEGNIKDKFQLTAGNLKLDLKKRRVWLGSTVLHLQNREFTLLEYLMRNAGQLVSRTMLLENVWEYKFEPQTNVIDVHISRLRSKIDVGRDKSLVTTIRGSGYVFDAD